MTTKQVKPELFFYYSEETTLPKIHEVATRECNAIISELHKSGLEATSPMQFVYRGLDGDPSKPFTLEIGFAIKHEKKINDKYAIKELEAFNCAATEHKGDIHKLNETYDDFMGRLIQSEIKISDQCREIYTTYVTETSPENVTEVQVGIN